MTVTFTEPSSTLKIFCGRTIRNLPFGNPQTGFAAHAVSKFNIALTDIMDPALAR